ncbi:MAG: hypothetical protein E7424_00830 [Ruminococcaceae bacterium]|jgi:hypothetical protein|nr:hypothetical protein [Oscillospiraceae bacterium]
MRKGGNPVKRIVTLALVIVMLASLFTGLSLPAAAADPITVEKDLTLTACQALPGGRVDFFSDLEKYSRVSPIDSVEEGWYLELPLGMSWSFNDARELYIKGTPTETGDFYARWNVTLENGQRIYFVLYLTVNPTKTIDSEQTVTTKLGDDFPSTSFTVSQYNDGTWYEACRFDDGELPPGMDWISGEVDAPRLLSKKPTAAGTYVSFWKILLGDGTLINHTLTVKVTPAKTVESAQNVSINVNEDIGSLSFAIDKEGMWIEYCHLVEGALPWGMDWTWGEVDAPRLLDTPRVPGDFPTLWEITLGNGTLIRHTINIHVIPTKVYNSSQMASLTAFEYETVYFDVEKYTETYGYVDCELVDGELPPGMDWIYGEVDPPRIYGTVGEQIPTRGKEQFERNDPSGTYVSKWKISTGDGIQINHTLTCVVTKDGNPFSDVKDSDYFFKPVLWAVTHDPQVTNGVSLTNFGPNQTCTRGQVVTFLWRAVGCPEPKVSSNPFVDVKQTDYFYEPVLWALGEGITKGIDATHFGPGRGCTRGQVVTFLWRTEGEPAPSGKNPFKDVTAEDYFYKPVLWAVEQGITNGTSPNTFAPNATCTRGQIVTFLYRDLAPANILAKTDLLMYVEDVMTVTGRGVVITGRIDNGKVKTGDKIRIIGSADGDVKDETFTVEGIEMFHKIMDSAEAGDNVGILLGDVDKSLVARGDAMVGGKSDLVPVTKLNGTLELLTRYDGGRHNPISDGYKPQVYVATNDVTGTVTGLPNGTLDPGGKAYNVSIELAEPTFVHIGQEVAIREGGRTAGTFTVTEIQK